MLYHQFVNELGLKPLGGAEEIRTPDPLRARQVLYQLSYSPISIISKIYETN